MANISFKQNILPKTDNTYYLGNSSYKWHAYLATINGSPVSNLFLPAVTSSDNGKILKVVNGDWAAANTMTANEMPMSSSDATTAKAAIDTLNSKISPITISCTSLSDFESKLNTLLSTMSNGEFRNIYYSPSGAYAPFKDLYYVGFMYRVSATVAWCDIRRNDNLIYGEFHDNTWTWDSLALNSKIAHKPNYYNLGNFDTDTSIVNLQQAFSKAFNVIAGGTIIPYSEFGEKPVMCTFHWSGAYIMYGLVLSGNIMSFYVLTYTAIYYIFDFNGDMHFYQIQSTEI